MSDQPDWNFWRRRIEAPVWQVVALALDLQADESAWDHPAFVQLLETAHDHIRDDQLDVAIFCWSNRDEHLVKFAEFRRWGKTQEIKFPERFPGAQESATGANASEPADKASAAERRPQFLAMINQEKAKGNRHFVKTVADHFGVTTSYVHKVIGPRMPESAREGISDAALAGRSVFDRSKAPKR